MSGDGDSIFIAGLAIHAYHGVMEHEATVGQTFLLDLELGIDLAEASRSDKIASTVSYNEVVDCVHRAFCADRFRLEAIWGIPIGNGRCCPGQVGTAVGATARKTAPRNRDGP